MKTAIFVLGAIALFATASFLMMSHESNDSNVEVLSLWKDFKKTYNKKYSSAQEEMYRMQVFMDTLKYIEANQGETYTLGVNVFADITNEEFRSTYLGYAATEESTEVAEEEILTAPPASVNWVEAGIVPPILNQANCGSCWAFSAAGSISMAYNVGYKNNSLQLSPEQLVQCSKQYGNNGCNGGLMNNAFKYAMANGLDTNDVYPYTSGTGVTGTCNTTLQGLGTYKVKSYTNVAKGSVVGLQTAVALQPTSIAVDASTWQYYKNGVFSNCGTSLDHGVIAVGYNSTSWLVKNSWGTGWGENGYIQLKMGNTCGLANSASYPTV